MLISEEIDEQSSAGLNHSRKNILSILQFLSFLTNHQFFELLHGCELQIMLSSSKHPINSENNPFPSLSVFLREKQDFHKTLPEPLDNH